MNIVIHLDIVLIHVLKQASKAKTKYFQIEKIQIVENWFHWDLLCIESLD